MTQYLYGTDRNRETLRTKSEAPTHLSGFIQTVQEYPDSIVTDTCCIVRKLHSGTDVEGNCYDFYEIGRHNRTIDKTPAAISRMENLLCELDMENAEQLGVIENALCELDGGAV